MTWSAPSPEYFLVKTHVDAHTLCPALLIAGGDGGELAVPGLAFLVPASDLQDRRATLLEIITTGKINTAESNQSSLIGLFVFVCVWKFNTQRVKPSA